MGKRTSEREIKKSVLENNPNPQGAIKVNKGIPQPPSVSIGALNKIKKKRQEKKTADDFFQGILNCDTSLLSQAITIIESSLDEHQKIGQKIIEKCLPYSGKSIRIGITGVPGVGKSTFIEAMGKYLIGQGYKLAVLAVDPSSEKSKGSILGDKTRMETLSTMKNAFIRPSPSAGSLGGVARKTREIIFLCEAAGFDIIFIETVGVGQSEVAVSSMVDFFLLLMLAGAGDELQGIKRGIMEMADSIAITKADGDNLQKAEFAKNEYANALHLLPAHESGWIPKTLTCSAKTNTGINDVWKTIEDYIQFTKSNNFFQNKRKEQSKFWMYETINNEIKGRFYNDKTITNKIREFESMVLNDEVTSFVAAQRLLEHYFKR